MNKLYPSTIDDNNSGNVYENSQPTGLFSSNLVGGKKISRRNMRKIYKSYKKRKHHKGSMKHRIKSIKGNFLTRMFNKMNSKKMRKSSSRRRQRGGNTFVNRALAMPGRIGDLTSCIQV